MDATTSSSAAPAVPSDAQSQPLWLKRVPMITGVLAGLAGFLTVRSANMSNQANYRSTIAVLHQAKSSDAWAEYEADSVKRHIDETALKATLSDPAARPALEADVKDYRGRQAAKKQEANAEATLRDQELDNGAQKLAQKDFLDYAGVAAQLGIAMASIAALTRKQHAFNFGVIIGLLALGITGYALIQPYVVHLFQHR